MIHVKKRIRYDVTDTTCPSKLFDANDISIQKVAMDTNGTIKEWVGVVELNTRSENGYLQSELPYCKIRPYLIGAKVKVKAYLDTTNCCEGLRDFKKCENIIECKEKGRKLVELKDGRNYQFSRDVELTGSEYKIIDSHHHRYDDHILRVKDHKKRRRRLLVSTGSARGSCANRL